MKFTDLSLLPSLIQAVHEEGYTEPTPIQEQAIPPGLQGRDVLGCAQTGTGKTCAFTLPILQRLTTQAPTHPSQRRAIRTLVLAPTRELALQIAESFAIYGKHVKVATTVIFGGVGQNPQVDALRRGVDVLVATPGRLRDLMNQGFVHLNHVEVLVLDEADRMLDMGFVREVERIVAALPKNRQTMLFSATMAPEVLKLAEGLMHHPVRVSVTPQATTVEKISQSIYHVEKALKPALLQHLLETQAMSRVIIFSRTKHGADRIVRTLEKARIPSAAIHGNKSQNARVRALDGFKAGTTPILVATDIAARGIDVDGISHVINFDLPNIPDSYVHRIGRTARAGASGAAISFCDSEERAYLKDIERLIRIQIPVVQRPADLAVVAPVLRPGQTEDRPDSGRSQSRRPQSSRPQSARPASDRPSAPRPQQPHADGPRPHQAPRQSQRQDQRPNHPGQRPQHPQQSHAPQSAQRPAWSSEQSEARPQGNDRYSRDWY